MQTSKISGRGQDCSKIITITTSTCSVLQQGTFKLRITLVDTQKHRNRWRRPNMTEKLLIVTLSQNHGFCLDLTSCHYQQF